MTAHIPAGGGGGAGSPEEIAIEIARRLRGKMSIEAWLTERADNYARIALRKAGDDRRGWLEDEAYFRAAIKAIRDAWARALEEAAKVAEALREETHGLIRDGEVPPADGLLVATAARDIASAIRSLKAQP